MDTLIENHCGGGGGGRGGWLKFSTFLTSQLSPVLAILTKKSNGLNALTLEINTQVPELDLHDNIEGKNIGNLQPIAFLIISC